MKCLLLFLFVSFIFFGSASKASATGITKVNTSSGSDYTGASSSSLAVSAASLTTGNFIVVGLRFYNPGNNITVTSITDTAGNTYTKATGRQGTYTTTRGETWYAKNTTANGSNVVTVHTSSAVQYWGVVTTQYSGIDTSSPLDTTATGDKFVFYNDTCYNKDKYNGKNALSHPA